MVRLGFDNQGEDKTQTHHWQRIWQLWENYKLLSATEFKRTLQTTLCMDSIQSDGLMREDISPPQFIVCNVQLFFHSHVTVLLQATSTSTHVRLEREVSPLPWKDHPRLRLTSPKAKTDHVKSPTPAQLPVRFKRICVK